MGATAAIRARDGGSLGPWVLAPWAILLALIVLSTQLPAHNCGEGGLGSDALGIVFEVIGFGGALFLGAAGIWRIARLVRGRGAGRWADGRLVAVVGLALAAYAIFAVRNTEIVGATILGLVFFALLVSGFCFLALAVAWIQRQRADDVGILLPAYLLGGGLSLCLVVAVAGVVVGGCWGE